MVAGHTCSRLLPSFLDRMVPQLRIPRWLCGIRLLAAPRGNSLLLWGRLPSRLSSRLLFPGSAGPASGIPVLLPYQAPEVPEAVQGSRGLAEPVPPGTISGAILGHLPDVLGVLSKARRRDRKDCAPATCRPPPPPGCWHIGKSAVPHVGTPGTSLTCPWVAAGWVSDGGWGTLVLLSTAWASVLSHQLP